MSCASEGHTDSRIGPKNEVKLSLPALVHRAAYSCPHQHCPAHIPVTLNSQTQVQSVALNSQTQVQGATVNSQTQVQSVTLNSQY